MRQTTTERNINRGTYQPIPSFVRLGGEVATEVAVVVGRPGVRKRGRCHAADDRVSVTRSRWRVVGADVEAERGDGQGAMPGRWRRR